MSYTNLALYNLKTVFTVSSTQFFTTILFGRWVGLPSLSAVVKAQKQGGPVVPLKFPQQVSVNAEPGKASRCPVSWFPRCSSPLLLLLNPSNVGKL